MSPMLLAAAQRMPSLLAVLVLCISGNQNGITNEEKVTMVCSGDVVKEATDQPRRQTRHLSNAKQAALYAFKPEPQDQDGMIMKFTVDALNPATGQKFNDSEVVPELHAYLFNDRNPTCGVPLLKDLSAIFTDCIDALEFAKCLTVTPIWQLQMGAMTKRASVSEQLDPTLHLTMNATGSFTVSPFSTPQYNSTHQDVVWYMLIVVRPSCEEASLPHFMRCPKAKQSIDLNVSVTMTHEGNVTRQLWLGAAQMFAIPIVVLVLADCVRMLARMGLATHPEPARPLTWPSFVDILRDCVIKQANWWMPNWISLLFMCAMTWISGSLQFVLSSHLGMTRSGNRDTCYYNDRCYYPAFADIPFNNILSHIPYLVCGWYSFFMAARAQIHMYRRMPAVRDGTKCFNCRVAYGRENAECKIPDLICEVNVFYGLALGVTLEAIGSVLYHVCPSSYVFQFDTTFMLPICHLSTYAVLGISETYRKKPRMGRRAVRYFLVIAAPLWILGFLGTWIDMGQLNLDFDKTSRWMFYLYCFWGTYAVIYVVFDALPDHAFLKAIQGRCPKVCSVSPMLLRIPLLVVFFFAGSVLYHDNMRIAAGQTPNVLLAFSVLIMLIAFFGRVFFHLGFQGWGFWRSAVPVCMAMVIAVTVPSLDIFNNEKVNNVLSTSEISRNTNKPCVIDPFTSRPSVFDPHDIWHLGSAIGLALWIMCLLELRLEAMSFLNVKVSAEGLGDSMLQTMGASSGTC